MLILPAGKVKSEGLSYAPISQSGDGYFTASATIPEVDPNNTIVLPTCIYGVRGSDPYGCGSVHLYNSTTVRVPYYKLGAGTLSLNVHFQWIEYFPGQIKSIKQIAGGSSPQTIAAVGPKAVCIGANWAGYITAGMYLTYLNSSTQMIVATNYAAAALRWLVIDYY